MNELKLFLGLFGFLLWSLVLILLEAFTTSTTLILGGLMWSWIFLLVFSLIMLYEAISEDDDD